MKEFKSPEEFATHLLKMAGFTPVILQAGLTTAAKLIKNSAKEELGHLQPQVGPFSAWEELKDSTKKEKERLGYKFNDEYNPLVRTGELLDSYQYRTAPLEAVIGSKLDTAYWHEFGTTKMVERPVLGPAAFKNKEKIKEIMGLEITSGLFGVGKKITITEM